MITNDFPNLRAVVTFYVFHSSENKAQSGKVTKFSRELVSGYDNGSRIILGYIRDRLETHTTFKNNFFKKFEAFCWFLLIFH